MPTCGVPHATLDPEPNLLAIHLFALPLALTSQSFAPAAEEPPSSVRLVDLDGDGRLDQPRVG